MAADAVVSVVIQKLTDMLIEESISFDKVIDQVEDIRIRLRRMRGFLIDAEKKQESNECIRRWIESYLNTIYSVEDIVETFVLGIARRRSTSGKALFTLPVFMNSLGTRKLRKEIKKIWNDIDGLDKAKPKLIRSTGFKLTASNPGFTYYQRSASIAEEEEEEVEGESGHGSPSFRHMAGANDGVDGEDGGHDDEKVLHERALSRVHRTINSSPRSNGPSFRDPRARTLSFQSTGSSFKDEGRLCPARRRPISSYYVGESTVMGFDDEKETLVTQLLDDGGQNGRRSIISIVGTAGSGKTTLARAIYRSRDVKLHFKHRAWIYVSKEHEGDTRGLLLSILKQVAKVKEQGFQSSEQLTSRLADFLMTRRYLLVMDDIRTAKVWENLRGAFPEANDLGSRVLFTARFEEEIAMFSDFIHCLEPLNEQYSWELFANVVGLAVEKDTSEMSVLQERVLTTCEGSPLSIVLLGGLLSTKKASSEDWLRILDHMASQDLDALTLSYNDLPFHSKLCLLYLGLFPKEFEISVRRLFRLWLAEGFVKRSLGMSPEDLAEEYFNDLIYRNLIQLSKVRSDGTPKKCCMPGIVYDELLSKAQDISLFHVHRNSGEMEIAKPPSFGIRRIVEYTDIENYDSDLSSNIKHLRSYLSFNTQKKDTPAKEVGNFLDKIVGYGLLRVLDLEGVYKPSLPDTLGNLFHLRYLGLRWTFLDTLPESVGNLPYLETLDVKHTYINSIPSAIWNLMHLRHLNLNGIRLDMPKQQRNSSLTRLLTLWGLFVDKHSPVRNGLNRLCDLRELGITCHVSSVDEVSSWIAGLTALQSLRLRSKDDMGRPSKLSLKPLSNLGQLSHLYLLGHMDKLFDKHEFPPTLKVLTLSISRLQDDPMRTLGQLPSLSVLRLYASSYLGINMVCHLGSFAKLRVLKLWMLQNLEKWEVKEGAMPRLQKLEIRHCTRLKEFPSRLLLLGSLEDLILTAMPAAFVNDVLEKKPQTISLTDNSDWNFTPLPWEKDEPSA